MKEFERLCKGVARAELDRAKVQLKSQLMMNLEVFQLYIKYFNYISFIYFQMRPVQFEDMARQILVHGERKHPLEYCEKIGRYFLPSFLSKYTY